MPRKTSKTSKTTRTTSQRRAAPRKTGSQAKKTPARRPSNASAPRSRTAARRGSPALLDRARALFARLRRPASKPRAATPPPARKPVAAGWSLDRKLDLVGILMLFVGLVTLLSLFSANRSAPTDSWLSFLGLVFGWGAFFFPIALFLVGLWLVLRNFERVPQVSVERAVGLLLLFAAALAAIHLLLFPETRQASYDMASARQGGGLLGAFIFELLRGGLGLGGAAIALVAWLLIALALSVDRSVVELFGWLPPLALRIQDWVADTLEDWRNQRKPATGALFPPTTGALPRRGAADGAQPAEFLPATDIAPQPSMPLGLPRAWVLPKVDEILDPGGEVSFDDEFDRQRAGIIEETLASFGAPVNVVEINRGPTITQFGVEPDFIETRSGRTRVRVGKIASLADDLALALAARTIRVQAPVPGKGYVGIEVPNEEIALVALRDVVESEAFKRLDSPLRFTLGQDVAGNAAAADLSAMPHLLIAGATGSGKSVCVNSLICCLLLHNTPETLRLIMVDPKRVELTGYNGIPHLLAPVVVELERVVGALQWVLREMDMRYHKLAQAGARNILEYNARLEASGQKKLPRLVVIIDELADLMMLAPDETERTVTRLAQLARATGIHLVIATQRPSVDVVTGLIKANFPARIAFAVASNVDSRVIIDQPGAERLLGRGDMLFQAPDAAVPIRLQGTFVSEAEIYRLVSYWQSFTGAIASAPSAAGGIVDALPTGIPLKQMPLWEKSTSDEEADPLLEEAIDLARRQARASISMLQRRLRIGYTRAARLIETMQEMGIIGEEPGPQGFEILDYGPAAPPADAD